MPAGSLGFALEMDQTFGLEGLEYGLDAPGGLAGQDLLEIFEPGPFIGFPDVLEDQLALGRPLEALDAGVAAPLAQGAHEATGRDDPAPGPLQDARFHQQVDAGSEIRRDGVLAVRQVQHHQMVGVEAPDLLLADGLQEAQESRVLDLPLQGEPDLVVVGAVEDRRGLASRMQDSRIRS